MNDIKRIDIKEFREKGYLQEINRKFLHPLGLALEISIDEETMDEKLGGIWDYRNDPEGIIYDLKNSDEERIKKFKKNQEFINNEFKTKKQTRIDALGYNIELIESILDEQEKLLKIKEKTDKILYYENPLKTRGFEFISKKHKKFGDDVQLPLRGSKTSAGYDFYSNEDKTLIHGEKYVFWTDIKAYMMPDEVLKIYIRSSFAIKKGLILKNQTGIIDSDFYSNIDSDGNIGICLKNDSESTIQVEKGDRIAQGIFTPFLISDNCNSEKDRKGGIGSS